MAVDRVKLRPTKDSATLPFKHSIDINLAIYVVKQLSICKKLIFNIYRNVKKPLIVIKLLKFSQFRMNRTH